MSIKVVSDVEKLVPEGYCVFEVYASESKEKYPRIAEVNEQLKKLYELNFPEFYPNFVICPKEQKAGVMVKFQEELRPVICFESKSQFAIGVLHEKQLEKYHQQIFTEVLSGFSEEEPIDITALVNTKNKWSISPFIGSIFQCSEGKIKSYKAREINGTVEVLVY